MQEIIEPFEFKQCASILKTTGKKARNLRELRDLISTASDESLFHHTYQYFMKGRILEYTNGFAQWAGEGIEERVLAEHLSNLDPYDFKNLGELRNELLKVIDKYLEIYPEPREVIAGDEFYFNETVTMIFQVGITAKNTAEFLTAVKYVDAGSVYYHFYEARVRLGGGVDDFSAWFDKVLMKKELAEKIKSIDPFIHSIEGIRGHIVEAVEEEVKRDTEAIKQ